MRHVVLAVLVFVLIPYFAQAQEYSSPSVMRIWQYPSATAVEFGNYSYMDRPFEGVGVNVSVGYYISGENVVHQLSVSAVNSNNRHVVFGSTPYYCRTFTNDCKPFACNYYSSGMELEPRSSKQKSCVVTAGDCAGREIRMDYALQGVRGTVNTKTVVKCPQKFCDQVSFSAKVPGISYAGDKILVEGFLKNIGGEGVPSPVSVNVGNQVVKTASNGFGYWSAPLEMINPGYYELSAASESCGRIAKAQFWVIQKEEEVFAFLSIYPKNIDVRNGGVALLAINMDSDEKTPVSISGVPEGWIEPAEFSMSRGIKFVYVSPDAEGNYRVVVRAGPEERNISLFVAPATTAQEKTGSTRSDALVFIAGLLLLLYSKKFSGMKTEKRREYLGAVKKEIEDTA